MKFSYILEQIISHLRHKKRLSYRFLKTTFDLSDDYLRELKAELIQARKLAVDDNDAFLVWCPSQAFSTSTINTKSHVVWAERRQLTVLVCDMLGTADRPAIMASEQRPDQYRRYDDACLEVVRRLNGYVAQQIDHALLVYFGYPQAREDDAKRAVQAALEMLDAVHQLNHHSQEAQTSLWLAIRLSLHTDLTLVGASELPDQNLETTDELVKVARQLCGYAPQNTVVMSAETYRLVQDEFVCHDLGPQPLKGHAKPVQIYSVLRQREASHALEHFRFIYSHTLRMRDNSDIGDWRTGRDIGRDNSIAARYYGRRLCAGAL